jgi:hypothetical protein
MALLDEVVLHVHHNQSRLARVDRVEWVKLPQALFQAVGGGLSNRYLVHFCFLN